MSSQGCGFGQTVSSLAAKGEELTCNLDDRLPKDGKQIPPASVSTPPDIIEIEGMDLISPRHSS